MGLIYEEAYLTTSLIWGRIIEHPKDKAGKYNLPVGKNCLIGGRWSKEKVWRIDPSRYYCAEDKTKRNKPEVGWDLEKIMQRWVSFGALMAKRLVKANKRILTSLVLKYIILINNIFFDWRIKWQNKILNHIGCWNIGKQYPNLHRYPFWHFITEHLGVHFPRLHIFANPHS